LIKLTDILSEILTEKKLCPKGEAYRQRRLAAGEVSSAYLSARGRKVCKGLMKEFLNEEIDPSEAYNDTDAIDTLVKRKRDLAFIVQGANTDDNWKNIQKTIKDNDIKIIYVKGNPYNAYIAYLSGSENKATKLKDLAEKYDGYLSAQATKEDTIQMGRLLGYKEDKIKEYVNKNFPNDPIDESLNDWFKKKWVRIDTQGNITGPCGTMKQGKATTRCLPRAKANSLTKDERAATARKKVAGSKKGKQFVSNTKKAKVKFNKENLDEMNLKQGLAAAGIALSTLLGTPDTSKASTPTSMSQVVAKSIIEKVVKGFEKEGYKIDFLETAKYKNFNNAEEEDIKVEFGAAKTISAARLTLMEFIRVNKLDRNKTLFMFNPEEEQFIIIYTK
jgi:hypothetical protein